MQQFEALWRARRRGWMCRKDCQNSHSKRSTSSTAATNGLDREAVLFCIAVIYPCIAIPGGSRFGRLAEKIVRMSTSSGENADVTAAPDIIVAYRHSGTT